MNQAGSTWGKKLRARVWIGISSEARPGNGACHDNPASGYLWIGGTRYAVGTSPWIGHCG